MTKDLIIACDFPDKKSCLAFLENFPDEKPYLKIGMELFYSEGPAVVTELKKRGHKIFLDLKLHDIPNTVEKAMMSIATFGVDMCNVHALGGRAMMEAAVKGLRTKEGVKTKLIAVTQLTSTSQEQMSQEQLIAGSIGDVVLHYAKNAAAAGVDGVVCSALEAALIKETCGNEFLTVTPGIRPKNTAAGDQSRITTPQQAFELGADYIVVGRPITEASDPLHAYKSCLSDFLSTVL